MAEEEPYEIMPYKEIVELRKQIQDLKSKGSDTGSKQLIDSMSKLTEQMNSMVGLFKTAAEEMRLEEKDDHFVAKKIEPLVDKLNEIVEQNKIIAEGMVAVADMIKEYMERKNERPRSFLRPEPGFKPFEPPEPEFPKFDEPIPRKEPMPRHTPPRPMPSMQMPSMPEPFPFEEQKKRKGLFNKFKK